MTGHDERREVTARMRKTVHPVTDDMVAEAAVRLADRAKALAERRETVDEYIFEVRDGRGPEERRERVVRCRDCRWYLTGNLSGRPVCMRLFELVEIDVPVSARVSPDGFCWHGEERGHD